MPNTNTRVLSYIWHAHGAQSASSHNQPVGDRCCFLHHANASSKKAIPHTYQIIISKSLPQTYKFLT